MLAATARLLAERMRRGAEWRHLCVGSMEWCSRHNLTPAPTPTPNPNPNPGDMPLHLLAARGVEEESFAARRWEKDSP